jgi:hypothetical protein
MNPTCTTILSGLLISSLGQKMRKSGSNVFPPSMTLELTPGFRKFCRAVSRLSVGKNFDTLLPQARADVR